MCTAGRVDEGGRFCKPGKMSDSGTRPFNILVLCTGNSARLIIAEALFSELGAPHRVLAWSAGSKPAGQPHPNALKELKRRGHRTEFYRSKSWDEFGEDVPEAPVMDMVVTVCGNAAAEVCPAWAGGGDPVRVPIRVHWGADDPAHIEDDAERERAFAEVYDLMRRRVEAFLALPREQWRDPDAVRALA